MKLFTKLVAVQLLCFSVFPVMAQVVDPATQQTSDNTGDLVKYLKNLASYWGYDITNPPESPPTAASTQLFDPKSTSLFETSLYSTFFGAIPVPALPNNKGSSSTQFQFLPGAAGEMLNSAANLTFSLQNFSSPSNSGSTVTVSPLIDQQPYQADPVSQAVLNILGTPDVSYCTDSQTGIVTNPNDPNGVGGARANNTQCPIAPTMFQAQVMENIVGKIPSSTEFFSFDSSGGSGGSNASQAQLQLLPQLNSNSLLAPLYFDTQASSSGGSSGDSGSQSSTSGLSAQSQAQQAANFIRYVSGSVVPTTLPSQTAYSNLLNQIQSGTPAQQATAEAALSSYLLTLRVYAAQSSVGIGNLYYILSKRLPQQQQSDSDQSDGSNTPVSQALNEYNMATWRIYQPNSSTEKSDQWLNKINAASPASVEKEIAILLSEINYQLYLGRQIQERLLLTSSVSLLQSTKAGQPSADLSNQIVAAPTSVTTGNSE